MTEYHVRCGIAGIYAGTLKPKKKDEWLNKSDVTYEAMGAVAQYLLFSKKELRFKFDEQWYVMRIKELTEEKDD